MMEPIAIIGSACRFPGSASSPARLWDLLRAPKDLLKEELPERRASSGLGRKYGKRKYQSYLLDEDIRRFDADFFRINYKEAKALDPQQRLLLETVFEAMEVAGWPLEKAKGSKTSVHVGVMTSDYADIQMRDVDTLPTYAATGLARSMLSNRISHFFDFRGPSATVDTACSSSLVALYQAVQCLRDGDASCAVVAGSSLLLDSGMYAAETNLGMLSPTSRSRMWDRNADGYARGEGCAAILLKPLSKAIADQDEIDCVIRAVAVNSDGFTNGITMPNSNAQTNLIRSTYEKAGLDPVRDRCQYFECHGTGTPAGDPVEARAIKEAFFPGQEASYGRASLYCGSIKTVIGHLEGCAGLAGILKASLAVQKGVIPPNLHFENLSPAVEPYCGNLTVPTSCVPWPETKDNVRRASVNSFGFGGTNAHVIIENYGLKSAPVTSKVDARSSKGVSESALGPFIFSAKKATSLLAVLERQLEHLRRDAELSLNDLGSWLQVRRTAFPVRDYVVASDREELIAQLEDKIQLASYIDSSSAEHRDMGAPSGAPKGILGVFTGQGAQWTAMGRSLLAECVLFRKSINRCEIALTNLPDPPKWSLAKLIDSELAKYPADICQPLCTAIQIALVDVLRTTGVSFAAVVGHSSGEIAAAYACGLLSLKDAMGIAYYRGTASTLSCGRSGEPGGMMAVGLSYEDALAFCKQPKFQQRLTIAACNAPAAVTLSGDRDAIYDAKDVFDQQSVFAKILPVEIAYHSHHMARCVEAYTASLQRMQIQLQQPKEECKWFSSVYEDWNIVQDPPKSLSGQYWIENLSRPVLFAQALESTTRETTGLEVAVEVGPHPALRTVCKQIWEKSLRVALPYAGCLQRGENDVKSLSNAIGLLWAHSGAEINFAEWQKAFGRKPRRKAPAELPSYPWDHNEIFWQAPRASRQLQDSTNQRNEILGYLQEDHKEEMAWRNVFGQDDMPWVKGHIFQGQVVFPAAAYISMAIEASKRYVRDQVIARIELFDIHIPKALVVPEDPDRVETLFRLSSRICSRNDHQQNYLEATFTCYSGLAGGNLDRSCEGRIVIHLGNASHSMLQDSTSMNKNMPPMDIERFFSALSNLGIIYEGAFGALDSLYRIWGSSESNASWFQEELSSSYSLHPAILDVGFQTGFATFVSAAEDTMGSPCLPTRIGRIIFEPACATDPAQTISLSFNAHLVSSDVTERVVDVNIIDSTNQLPMVQVDGLVLQVIAEPSPSEDRQIFAKTVWDVDVSHEIPECNEPSPRIDEIDYIDAVERTALFFLRNASQIQLNNEHSSVKSHHRTMLHGIKLLLAPIYEGRHPFVKQEWLDDTQDDIQQLRARFPESVDLALLTAVGENLPSVVRGESEMLEHMLKDNLLTRLYSEGRGFARCNEQVGYIMNKIAHKFPRMKILEVGAGTGGTTQSVLDAVNNAYLSYTYTDISAGFFERAAERFEHLSPRVDYKVLNLEISPMEQGFTPGSYDIIIAANVLHATNQLSRTMQYVRGLLRPGGFLIAVEVTGTMLREPGLMAGLEGWWLGVNDGRFPCPGIPVRDWDQMLIENGFTGVDHVAYDFPDITRHNCSVFVTQATCENFEQLMDPLSYYRNFDPAPQIVLIGGSTLPVVKATRHLRKILQRWPCRVTTCKSLDELVDVPRDAYVVSLTELDCAVFAAGSSSAVLDGLQSLFSNTKYALWVTSGAHSQDPFSNMMLGIGRSLDVELAQLGLQFIDFDHSGLWDMEMVAKYLLRAILLSSQAYDKHDLLWCQEPEVYVTDSGVRVPRLVQDTVANEDLNAHRRRIHRDAMPYEAVELELSLHSPQLVLSRSSAESGICDPQAVQINVEKSVALQCCQESPLALCYGQERETGNFVIALSERQASVVFAERHHVLRLPFPPRCDSGNLVATGAYILAEYILHNTSKSGTAIVHDPGENVARALLKLAAKRGQKLLLVSASIQQLPSMRYISPVARTRHVQSFLPKDASVFWRLGHVDVRNILDGLSEYCAVRTVSASDLLLETRLLDGAYKRAATEMKDANFSVINIEDVPNVQDNRLSSSVLNWRHMNPVKAAVSPINVTRVLSPDRTYVLVGMNGELGQSLCRFLVGHGVRYIAIASRNPDKASEWAADIARLGCTISVFQMDVTKKKDVKAVASKIRHTMPPIAGVANAALVLDDALFVNTTPEKTRKQLEPKVHGTMHLDEEFAQDDLRFFVAFSSLGSIYGNAGQSIYHAANMFMTSLIEKRRRNGQVGSILNLGMVVDVGYVAAMQRSKGTIEQHLRQEFYTALSETEFHQAFIQAVISGATNSTHGDVTIGLQPFSDHPNAKSYPHWYNNPRFSHMIVPPTTGPANTMTKDSSRKDLENDFKSMLTQREAQVAIVALFCGKIEAMMKIPAERIKAHEPLSSLGLDSLLAVEIRTWILKVLNIDVPMLSILGSESVHSVALHASRQLFEGSSPSSEEDPSARQTDRNPDEMSCKPQFKVSAPDESDLDTWDSDGTSVGFLSSAQDILSSGAITPAPSSKGSVAMSEDWNFNKSYGNEYQDQMRELDYTDYLRQSTTQNAKTGPMSFPQASMFFLTSLLNNQLLFNVTATYKIEGHLKPSRLSQALKKVLLHHEVFRTCFPPDVKGPGTCQTVLDTPREPDFNHLSSIDECGAEEIFENFSSYQYDLVTGPLFVSTLITHTPTSHTMVFGWHHMVMDGMSWSLFLRDLNMAYRMLPLDKPKKSYLDFACEQREHLTSGDLEKSICYWVDTLTPVPPPLPLHPLVKQQKRFRHSELQNHIARRTITENDASRIKQASSAHGVTALHFYLATFACLLAQLLESTDICIGLVHSGRTNFPDTIGHFTNLLPLLLRIDGSRPFFSVLKDTAKAAVAGLLHSDVPIDVLMERINLSRSSTAVPLFQVAFNYRIGDLLHGNLGDASVELLNYKDALLPYDLTVNLTQTTTGGYLLELVSNSNLYSTEFTEMVVDCYIDALGKMSDNQHCAVDEIHHYNDAQAGRTVQVGKALQMSHKGPGMLIERFLQVCDSNPHAPAIKDHENSLTYGELSGRVNALTHALRRENITRGSHIAVLCEPSIDTYAAMLAIFAYGAVYVPLDISLPAACHRVLMSTSKASVLMFHNATMEHARALEPAGLVHRIIDLSGIPKAAQGLTQNSPNDYDMLLFTSGSTGTPKGVRLSQQGVMNYAAAKQDILQLGQVKVLQQSSTGFDMSIAQAFNAFANCGTLIIVPQHLRRDPQEIANIMLQEEVNLTLCTPTEYVGLVTYASDTLRRCRSWKFACSGGEQVTESVIACFQRLALPSFTLLDCYGPTEVSCAVTFQPISLDAETGNNKPRNSVGKAIVNNSIFICGSNGQPLPIGFAGEICVAGIGVAKGYIDTADSAAKFVPKPAALVSYLPGHGDVVYKTGDKGCLREDGSLILLGRIDGDTTVKLRGLRIDLKEVEYSLIHAAGGVLTDAIVTLRGDPGFLVAHVLFNSGVHLSQKEIQKLCASLPLPDYMKPALVVPTACFPMTANGKVDRKAMAQLALPPSIIKNEEDRHSSLSIAEEEMCLLWRDVIGQAAESATIDADTDFFAIGGSSLLLVRLQGALRDHMGVRVELRELYTASSLRKMASAAGNNRSQLIDDTIDWDTEICLPDQISRELHNSPSGDRCIVSHEVILTGATSMLGSSILAALIARDDIAKIHCIAVPADSTTDILRSNKVVVYNGSLASNTLGLTDSEIATLQQNATRIIHAGSQGHCLNNYSSIRQANVLSTKFLACCIALPRKIPLHFISSGRVVLYSGAISAASVSMSAFPPPTDGSQGFTASKWASEVFLENLSRETNLPVVVHRPCSLLGDKVARYDALNAVIQFSILLRAVPAVPQAEGFFDFKEVKAVAKDITFTSIADAVGGVQFRHHSSGVKVPWCDLGMRLEEVHGGTFSTLEMKEWIVAAKERGLEDLITSYLEANVAGADSLTFPYLGED